MAENSKIEWTDATWNPITGCTMVSAGCTNCYAMTVAAGRLQKHPSREGLTRITGGRPVWTGEVRLNEKWLDWPLKRRKPKMIFVCAHGDLFHEAVPDEWIDRVFAVMALAPQHTFQVLTKRPERMRAYMCGLGPAGATDIMSRAGGRLLRGAEYAARNTPRLEYSFNRRWPLPNVCIGTSVEDQATADARIPHLLATPAAVRFVSAEPLLGLINPAWLQIGRGREGNVVCALTGRRGLRRRYPDGGYGPLDWSPAGSEPRLDWVIVGGESGPGARPMHPDWARSLRDQCQAAGVAFFFKQWGEWAPLDHLPSNHFAHTKAVGEMAGSLHIFDRQGGASFRVGKSRAGRLLDGREWNEMPGEAGMRRVG